MKITNEPLIENSPVKFTVTGFPEEEAIRSSIERFYAIKTEADRNFLVHNVFSEVIFTGLMNGAGKIESLAPNPRPGKSFGGNGKLK